jgi:hypothetical protein
MPPKPACQRPTDALSHSLSSSSHPGSCHRAPPHPGPACQSRPPHRPRPTVGGRCWPPQATDCRARHPPSPPSSTSTQTRPRRPPLFSSLPCAIEPLFKSVGRRPHCPHFYNLCPSSSIVTLPVCVASSRGPSQAPNAAPLRRFGSRQCHHLGLTVSSASSRCFHPNFLRSSLPLHLPVLQAPATTSADHRSSSLTPVTPLSRVTSATPPLRRHLRVSPPVPPCPVFSPFCA